MGVKRLEPLADLHVLVGADVVRAPDFLARRRIEGSDPAAHSHFAAARADDHFALHHYRRHGNCLAPGKVPHLGAPHLYPGRYVDRNGVPIEKVVEDLSVSVRSAAIHDIAARSTDRLLGVLGTELPLPRLARLSEIDRV